MNWQELDSAVKQAQSGIRNKEVRVRQLISLLEGAGRTLLTDTGREEVDLIRELKVAIRLQCISDKGIAPGLTVLYGDRGERRRGVVQSIAPGGWVLLVRAKRALPPRNMEVVASEVVQESK